MSDTKVLVLVLLTVFSAFIFQWAYFSSVQNGEIIWAEDIDPGEDKIPMEEEKAEVTAGFVIPGAVSEYEEEAPPWYKIWESVPYAFGKTKEKAKELGAKIISPFTAVWDWIERTHIFDVLTFRVWKGIPNTQVPKGIQYCFSLIMGIIIYAIPAYLIVKLIRGGG